MEKYSSGVVKLVAKVEDSLKERKFYEAHQLYRTIHFRLSKQEKFLELSELLLDGAEKLIAEKQFQSGSDLSLLLIDNLQKCKFDEKGFEMWIKSVGGLIEKIDSNVVERDSLIVKAVKWSCEGNKNNGNQGHPLLHGLIARTLAKEQNFEAARHHYLLSKDGIGCAKILIQISMKAFRNEMDLIITQEILNLLVLKETDTALSTFNSYCAGHPKIRTAVAPYRTPLLNFLYFLLKIIEEPKLSAFNTLCGLYKTALSRDPAFEKQLQVIGVSFFGAQQAAPARQNGLFGDLFSTLFQDLEDDSDDDDTMPTTSAQFRTSVDLD